MSKSVTGKVIAIATLVGLVALFLGFLLFQQMCLKKEIDSNSFHGTYLKQSRPVGFFDLIGTDGRTFDSNRIKGQWTMVFFGFTNCGYVCPTTMAKLGKTYRLIKEKKIKPVPQVVMISIDPERDNLEKLRNYVHSFEEHFYGARGSQDKIKQLTRELGVVYIKLQVKSKQNQEQYDIQHSGAIIVFNPKGELKAFFTPPHHPEFLVEDYLRLVS